MIVGIPVPTRDAGRTAKEIFVPTVIDRTVVPVMLVGTAVPTSIVLMAYYWKSCDLERLPPLKMFNSTVTKCK